MKGGRCMKKFLLSVLIVIAMLSAMMISASAEFGDFAGDSDYGGGYDSGYDYDYGDSDYDYDDDDDDKDKTKNTPYYSYSDYPDGGNYGGGMFVMDGSGNEILPTLLIASLSDLSSSDSESGAVAAIFIVGIALIVIVAVKRRKGSRRSYSASRSNNKPLPEGATPFDQTQLSPISSYTTVDPNFSEQEMIEKLSNLYVHLQTSWQAKNMEDLRPYFTDAMFNQFNRQLDAYRRNKQTNFVERVAVLGVSFSGWMKQGKDDVIVARLRTRFVDYVAEDETGKLVRGSKTAEKFMEYEWTLTRTSGTTTVQGDGTRTISCPHCGAPVDINKSAKCEFCDSVLTVDSFDWVISNIKGISQRTR